MKRAASGTPYLIVAVGERGLTNKRGDSGGVGAVGFDNWVMGSGVLTIEVVGSGSLTIGPAFGGVHSSNREVWAVKSRPEGT